MGYEGVHWIHVANDQILKWVWKCATGRQNIQIFRNDIDGSDFNHKQIKAYLFHILTNIMH